MCPWAAVINVISSSTRGIPDTSLEGRVSLSISAIYRAYVAFEYSGIRTTWLCDKHLYSDRRPASRVPCFVSGEDGQTVLVCIQLPELIA
jgi:hypothetical protein